METGESRVGIRRQRHSPRQKPKKPDTQERRHPRDRS